VQQKIGRLQTTVDAARALLYDTARRWSRQPAQRPQLGAATAAAKFHVTHAACEVTAAALDIAGGFSLTRRLPLERYFRDARGGLYQPLQDDLALQAIGRQALARRAAAPATGDPA
jgi:alkylation response protein AidB-like acyl-CoA dehydrogenase